MQKSLIRSAGFLMLFGGIIFWLGAFYPPYKQWMTSDLKEYLTIINAYQTNWYVIHGLFLSGVLLSVFGIQVLSKTLHLRDKNSSFAIIGAASFFLGSIFWIFNIAFRVTVEVSAAKQLARTGTLADWFPVLTGWTNLVFSFFMVISYFAIGCIGYAMKTTFLVPKWICWFCIILGFAGAIFYPLGFLFFEPPLMVYCPLILTGLTILIKIKK
jgi:hypothetical protein